MSSVLMVEDDAQITQLLEAYLPRYGLELFSVTSPSAALNKLEIEQYDLVLLDLSLPEMDGLELCKLIKKRDPNLPVIISTARGDVSDKVIGFEVGADDYIAKPYDPRELVARIQYHIKRSHNMAPAEDAEFRIDYQKFQIFHHGHQLDLTMAEFEIFALLIQNKHKVISREFILNSVNSINWDSSDRSINVIIGRIRHKLNDSTKSPQYIKSIRGVGYQYIGD